MGVEKRPWGWFFVGEGQLRRSSAQPLVKPLVGGFEEGCEFLAHAQNDGFAPSSGDDSARDHEEFIAAPDRFGMDSLIF